MTLLETFKTSSPSKNLLGAIQQALSYTSIPTRDARYMGVNASDYEEWFNTPIPVEQGVGPDVHFILQMLA